MTLRVLPEAKAVQVPQGYSWDVPSNVLARWVDMPMAASDAPETVTIYDVIGEDAWTGGGFTAKRMNAALRSIGAKDVTVKINSPGGSTFEGFAIYNELRQHKAKVTIEVMGIAASAAAYIAMAGDEIRMGLGSFLMMHNSWGMVVGNRNDLVGAMDILQQVDNAQIDIFEARTGLSRATIEKYMDAETFFGAADAVKSGFADSVMDTNAMDGAVAHVAPQINAKKQLDALLAQSGVPRSERRRMLNEATGGMHDAAPTVTHDAGLDAAAVAQLLKILRS